MSVIDEIKNNWKRGREFANAKKLTNKKFEDADISIELLDEELGPDPDRNNRYYSLARKPLNDYHKKYPQSRLEDNSIVGFIAETLPRKKSVKKSKPKPKRKPVKKCKCK